MLELVANNAPQSVVEAPPTNADLRALAQSALVRAAKKSPLRAVIILDLGEDGTLTLTAGLSRQGAIALTGIGVKDMQRHLTD